VVYQTTNQYDSSELTVTVTDQLTGESGSNANDQPDGTFLTVTSSGGTPDPTTVTGSDTGNRTWTLQSNVIIGSAPPFTGTAVLTAFA
jgi:hypothetical protein